ncbi:hypothetical protein GGF32_000298 [Allomyces javanicus]|nr:hypothetical protein GGF32_000298 [Allomyces javanicus]
MAPATSKIQRHVTNGSQGALALPAHLFPAVEFVVRGLSPALMTRDNWTCAGSYVLSAEKAAITSKSGVWPAATVHVSVVQRKDAKDPRRVIKKIFDALHKFFATLAKDLKLVIDTQLTVVEPANMAGYSRCNPTRPLPQQAARLRLLETAAQQNQQHIQNLAVAAAQAAVAAPATAQLVAPPLPVVAAAAAPGVVEPAISALAAPALLTPAVPAAPAYAFKFTQGPLVIKFTAPRDIDAARATAEAEAARVAYVAQRVAAARAKYRPESAPAHRNVALVAHAPLPAALVVPPFHFFLAEGTKFADLLSTAVAEYTSNYVPVLGKRQYDPLMAESFNVDRALYLVARDMPLPKFFGVVESTLKRRCEWVKRSEISLCQHAKRQHRFVELPGFAMRENPINAWHRFDGAIMGCWVASSTSVNVPAVVANVRAVM